MYNLYWWINPFHCTGIFLHPPPPLKTLEKLRFSDIFRGYRKRPMVWNRFTIVYIFLVKPHFKSVNCSSPSFQEIPPIYWFLGTPHPSHTKNRIFQWKRVILKFFTLNPTPKVTKFLVKTSQFKFLVMTERNIFVF